MTTIIAGRFEQQSQVQDTIDALLRNGFPADRISSFYVSSAGQHASYPVGGDRDKSPGAEQSPAGSAAGMTGGGAVGAAIGAATAPVTGPLGAITGAFVGAHVGSLIGSLGKMEEDGSGADENEVPVRHAGMMVAVGVPESADENRALDVLRELGAADIERTEGRIVEGDWQDFDPVAPPSYIDNQPAQRQ
jgi:hypothetical protein